MTVERVRIEVTGGPGGNGVTTLYFKDAGVAQPAVRDFAEAWSNGLPNDCQLLVSDLGDRINEETGEIVGSWTGGLTQSFVGLQSGAWIAGVGMRVRWRTSAYVAGRRVQGSSFIVPMAAPCFDVNGLPLAAWLTALGTAATALIEDTPGNMVVWSRPSGERLGSIHNVEESLVPSQGAFLRTRRT